MDGNKELSFRAVLGHDEAAVAGLVDVGAVAWDQQETGGVLPAGGADGVDEGLVDLVGQGVALVVGQVGVHGVIAVQGGVFVKAGADFLVRPFKDQVIAFLFEVFRQLGPHAPVGFHRQVPGFLGLGSEHAVPAAVPVVVEDHVHPFVQGPADHLGHAVDVGLVQGVVARGEMGGVGHPGHGNADGGKARLAQTVDHFPGGYGLAPQGFIAGRFGPGVALVGVAGLKGVAQVRAQAHQRGGFDRRFVRFFGAGRQTERQGQRGQQQRHDHFLHLVLPFFAGTKYQGETFLITL